MSPECPRVQYVDMTTSRHVGASSTTTRLRQVLKTWRSFGELVLLLLHFLEEIRLLDAKEGEVRLEKLQKLNFAEKMA